VPQVLLSLCKIVRAYGQHHTEGGPAKLGPHLKNSLSTGQFNAVPGLGTEPDPEVFPVIAERLPSPRAADAPRGNRVMSHARGPARPDEESATSVGCRQGSRGIRSRKHVRPWVVAVRHLSAGPGSARGIG